MPSADYILRFPECKCHFVLAIKGRTFFVKLTDLLKYHFMSIKYPDHFYQYSGERERAVDKLVERLNPRPQRIENTARAIGYTLGLYASVLTGEAYKDLLTCLSKRESRLSLFADRPGKYKLEEKYAGDFEPQPLPDYPVLQLKAPNNKQGLDRMHGMQDVLSQGKHINFSQSPSSAMPSWMISRQIKNGNLDIGDHPTIIDLCGAPGNKTLNLICELPADSVTAIINDPKPHRAERVKERLLSFGFTNNPKDGSFRAKLIDGKRVKIFVTQADASDSQSINNIADQLLDGQPANIVLADVPCPGDGRIHSDPSSACRRQPKKTEDVELQVKILESALGYVKPAPFGLAAYSTCSINPRINEVVVQTVLTKNRGVDCLDAANDNLTVFDSLGESDEETFSQVKGTRVYPQNMGGGFFVSLLAKTG